MSKYKIYNMWWAQSLSSQAFWYNPFKKTAHNFKGRTHCEAERKMKSFINMAQITGRFLCIEEGLEPKISKQQNPSNMIKEQLNSLKTVE